MKNEFSPSYLLHEEGAIHLTGEITSEMADAINDRLFYLARNGYIPTLLIDSPGGSVSAGMKIYDCINYLDTKVRTVVLGMAASMAALLLSAGSRGERYAFPNAEIMIHQPLGGMQGQASDMEIHWRHMHRVKQRLNTILADNTGKPIEQIAKDTDRDNFMTAEEALAYGLIDHILPGTNKAKGD
ncbi:MAG: ATP-dependent Clp protease proteolytic subunit [Clostridia bacterium]|nr:ATP-dependent Clp protease proteolytic subunit [Clostridia bacterium]